MPANSTAKTLQAQYDGHYETEDAEWRRLCAVDKAANVVALCGNLPTSSVLEIGAGDGSILERLSDSGFGTRLYALEISRSGVDAIKAKAIQRLVECSRFDGYQVPYPDDSFDLAVLSHVIEHVEHPRQLLYEAARVARYVFVEVPLEDTVRLTNDYVPNRVGHINFYSPRTIRRLLQSSGLRVLDQLTHNPRKETYAYQRGVRGLLNYYVKEAFLRVAPRLATGMFTYHAALVCARSDASPSAVEV